jgi:class 3 adenylate cyclase
MEPSSVKRRLTCILAADAVGYSRQMGQDEEGTIRVLSAHRSVIDGIITFHQGRIVSTAGDSVLAEFSSAVEAVRCAVEIQEALKTRNESLEEHRQMHFRVGVNLGDVVVKNEDLLGDGVNVAARLESMAEPGGICISSSVYDQITGKLDLGFLDIGEQSLKNISRPIRVYRVSGASVPVRPVPMAPPAAVAPRARSPLPWVIGAVVAVVIDRKSTRLNSSHLRTIN